MAVKHRDQERVSESVCGSSGQLECSLVRRAQSTGPELMGVLPPPGQNLVIAERRRTRSRFRRYCDT